MMSARVRTWLLVLVLVIGVMLICRGVYRAAAVHTRYVEEIARMHAAGIPTTLAGVFPSFVPPDDQNSALVYADIVKLHHVAGYRDKAEDAALAVTGASPTAKDWDKAQTFLSSNAALVADAHKGAALPYCIIPGRSTAADPAAISLPEFAPMRDAARILSIQSLLLAHEGKYDEAVRTASLGFKTADHAYSGPLIIGYLVGVAIDKITINSLDRIMLMARNDPNTIAKVDRAISDNWRDHSLKPALCGEAAFRVSGLEFLRGQRFTASGLVTTNDSEPSPQVNVLKAFASTSTSWNYFVDLNGANILRYQREAVFASSEPYPQAQASMNALSAQVSSIRGPGGVLTKALCPVFTACPAKRADIAAQAAMAHACAAVLTWKCRHGEYPASLQQAMPNVPQDPFDLKPIHYRREGGGFVLYSVGQGGVYDGGPHKGYETVLRVSADGKATTGDERSATTVTGA